MKRTRLGNLGNTKLDVSDWDRNTHGDKKWAIWQIACAPWHLVETHGRRN